MLTAKELREIIDYDPDTGLFCWRDTFVAGMNCARRRPRPKPGDVIRGSCNKTLGYLYIALNGRVYLAHRLAWLHVHGHWPRKGSHIDHIDHDGFNNRIANLREATRSENFRNHRRAPGVSGFVGVTWHAANKRWRATIWNNGKRIECGLFKTQEEAARARDVAATLEYGEFARLNF